MSACVLCLRQLQAPIPTGSLPVCSSCFGQLQQLPPAERMTRATQAVQAIEAGRYNDVLHMLAIQLDELNQEPKE